MAKTKILDTSSCLAGDDVWYCGNLLRAARDKEILLYTSLLAINECLFLKSRSGKDILTDEVKRLFVGLLTSGRSGVISIQPTLFILERARDLLGAWR